MAECAVKYSPAAVLADPREREIIISTVDAWSAHINRPRVEREQNPNSIAGELAKLVELLSRSEARRQVTNDSVLGVFYIDCRFLCPGVAIEIPADQVTVLRHRENQGVGAATVTGYSAAFAAGYEVAIKLDGDGQMDPGYIPDLVQPLLAREADYTKGNRFYQREHLTKMPTVRMFGNSVLSLMTKFSSGYWNIIDPTNGFTALHAVAAQEVDLAKVDHRYFFESDMLFRLNIARAVVKDVPMPAIYGLEHSNLSIGHVLLDFPFKHLRNLVKRFAYNYLVRDFSVGTIQAVAGLALTVFGITFGAVSWIRNAEAARDTPVGTVILATLPIILGFQLLLAALSFDIANIPSRPIQKR